jgi:hypothetical protein
MSANDSEDDKQCRRCTKCRQPVKNHLGPVGDKCTNSLVEADVHHDVISAAEGGPLEGHLT